MTDPVPVVDDPVAWCVADRLAACLCAQLVETSAPVACCCLMPGSQVAWDDCERGQAWVRVARVYRLGGTFPAAATASDDGNCGGLGGWAAVLELGVLRCMPQPDEGGALPSCDANRDVARLVLADAQAMRRAVRCCDWRAGCVPPDARMLLGDWLPAGPEGGCVGGTTLVTVEVSACVCEPG